LPLTICTTEARGTEDKSKGNCKYKQKKSDYSKECSRQELFPVVMPLAVPQTTAVSKHQHKQLKELQKESNGSKYDCGSGKKREGPPICKKA